MKKFMVVSLFLLSFLNSTTAQFTPTEGFPDYVLLKNGSKIYGKVIYYTPQDTLEFQIPKSRIIRCAPETVAKVVMARPKSANAPKSEKLYEFREHGIYGSAIYNMSFGRDKNGGGTHTGDGGLFVSAATRCSRRFGI